MKMVELKEYTSRIEAEMALDLLLDKGINAILQSDDMAGLNPSLGLINGYQIMVDPEHREEAESLLK